jgi:hypothetical protein
MPLPEGEAIEDYIRLQAEIFVQGSVGFLSSNVVSFFAF